MDHLPAPPAPAIAQAVRFARCLRDEGLAVTPAQTLDFVHSLPLIDVADRTAVRDAARAVFVCRREELPVFEAAFDRFWSPALLDPTVKRGLLDDRGRAAVWGADAVEAARRAVDGYLLGPWADRRAGGLSAGNWQRLGVACTTLHDPDALILDEPTSALDPAGVVIVRDMVRSLAARGAGVLVSSHHLDEVSRVADRIVLVHAGRVIGMLPPGAEMERRFFAMVLAADATGRAGR